MEVRGERECRECGTRWSYFETGSVACPSCGSIRSVGRGDRAEHTDAPATLQLGAALSAAGENRLREAAETAAEVAADYVRSRGFLHAGELQPLDGAYVAAQELRHAGVELARRSAVDAAEERYFLALLDGAPQGERPDSVPDSLRTARGLAAAAAVRAYVRESSEWQTPDPPARTVREQLTAHRKRLEALDGDVPPAEAERLLAAARSLGTYLRGEEGALALAEERLAELERP
jgi:uncharacterized Zn finger protein (UPF0148 family)